MLNDPSASAEELVALLSLVRSSIGARNRRGYPAVGPLHEAVTRALALAGRTAWLTVGVEMYRSRLRYLELSEAPLRWPDAALALIEVSIGEPPTRPGSRFPWDLREFHHTFANSLGSGLRALWDAAFYFRSRGRAARAATSSISQALMAESVVAWIRTYPESLAMDEVDHPPLQFVHEPHRFGGAPETYAIHDRGWHAVADHIERLCLPPRSAGD